MENDYWISIDIGKWIKIPNYSTAYHFAVLASKDWEIPVYLHSLTIQGKHLAFMFVNGEYKGNR